MPHLIYSSSVWPALMWSVEIEFLGMRNWLWYKKIEINLNFTFQKSSSRDKHMPEFCGSRIMLGRADLYGEFFVFNYFEMFSSFLFYNY